MQIYLFIYLFIYVFIYLIRYHAYVFMRIRLFYHFSGFIS